MFDYLEKQLPKLIMAPTAIVMLVCMYGFIGWTAVLSFTKSRMLPQWEFVGWQQYERLFANPRWHVALDNLFVFTLLVYYYCLTFRPHVGDFIRSQYS